MTVCFITSPVSEWDAVFAPSRKTICVVKCHIHEEHQVELYDKGVFLGRRVIKFKHWTYPTRKHLTKTQKTADSDPYRVLLIVIRLQNLPYLLSCLPQFTKNNFLHQRLIAQAGSLHWTEGKTYLPLTWKVWFLQAIQEVQKIYEDIYDEYMKNPGKVNRTIYHYHLAVSSSPELKCFVLLFYYHIII